MSTIAWIGLGNMGGQMTGNLVAAGHTVRGVDLNPEACAAAAALGVTIVPTVTEAVADADAVFTMLPKGDHVRSVFDGPDGIWANAPKTALLADSSTVDIATSRFCHEQSAQRGFRFVDAPVSGGVSGANAATLAFMLGGSDEDIATASEFIKPMAGNIIPAGGPTAGIAAKLANNMMLFISLIAAAEGSQLAAKLGLDPQVFWNIAHVSSADSWALRTWYPVPNIVPSAAANNNFDATFQTLLAHKDVSLALDAASSHELSLPAAELALSQFNRLIDEGLGGKDCSLIAKFVPADGQIDGYTAS